MRYSVDEIRRFAEFASRLADAARGQTLPRFRNESAVFNKAGPWFDPVTDADREAERVMRDMIERVFPEHGVLGEEFGERPGESGLRWVIDPVDGTRAFVCGTATWTTLIALEHEGAGVIGLIDQPFTDERWIAANGEAVFLRGDESFPCRTSGQKDLARARISTTDPLATGYFSEEDADAFARLNRAARVARFSMDAYAYGLLALGEIDIVAETNLQHHDYAALAPVIEAAGGVVTNWRGEPLGDDGRGEILAAASPELHEAALAALAG